MWFVGACEIGVAARSGRKEGWLIGDLHQRQVSNDCVEAVQDSTDVPQMCNVNEHRQYVRLRLQRRQDETGRVTATRKSRPSLPDGLPALPGEGAQQSKPTSSIEIANEEEAVVQEIGRGKKENKYRDCSRKHIGWRRICSKGLRMRFRQYNSTSVAPHRYERIRLSFTPSACEVRCMAKPCREATRWPRRSIPAI